MQALYLLLERKRIISETFKTYREAAQTVCFALGQPLFRGFWRNENAVGTGGGGIVRGRL